MGKATVGPPVFDIAADAHHGLDSIEILDRMRAAGPVVRITSAMGLQGWLVTRYSTLLDVLNDDRFSSDPDNVAASFRAGLMSTLARVMDAFRDSMISNDPPVHTRLRRPLMTVFTARRVESQRPKVVRTVDELLDKITGQRSADLVSAFTTPLPVTVICDLIGVPDSDRAELYRWSYALFTNPVDDASIRLSDEGHAWLNSYFHRLVKESHRLEITSLLAALIENRKAGRLSDRELTAMVLHLFIAGYEPVTAALGSSILELLRKPELAEKICNGSPAHAVDELLRITDPVWLGTPRYPTEDVVVEDVRIPRGEPVFMGYFSGNSDPSAFDCPHSIDLDRANARQHLTFGYGIHYCPGAALARMEIEIALSALLKRFPDLHLAVPAADLRWRNSTLRGLDSLPVLLHSHK